MSVLEAAAEHNKAVWVLDRPNPAGRPIEGLTLRSGWESFVGAGPIPMRHGLTLGELGHWFIKTLRLDVEYRVVAMDGWDPDMAPGFGWETLMLSSMKIFPAYYARRCRPQAQPKRTS